VFDWIWHAYNTVENSLIVFGFAVTLIAFAVFGVVSLFKRD
jgi:hypothetical protein